MAVKAPENCWWKKNTHSRKARNTARPMYSTGFHFLRDSPVSAAGVSVTFFFSSMI